MIIKIVNDYVNLESIDSITDREGDVTFYNSRFNILTTYLYCEDGTISKKQHDTIMNNIITQLKFTNNYLDANLR